MSKQKQTTTKNKQTQAQLLVGSLCLFAFSLVALCFGILIIFFFQEGYVKNHRILLLILLFLLVALILSLGLVFGIKNKVSFFRTSVIVAFLCAFFAIVYYVLLRSGFLKIISDPDAYKEFLASAGVWMALIYILLQYLQVVVLPIPSFVSTLAGVALFGPHLATLYSLIGIVLGSLTAFFIGRKLGYKAVAWIVGKEDLDKWQTKLKGKDNFVLTAMFLLPLFPDDVLCFVAGLSSMTNRYFIVMMIVCRIIGVTTTCYSIQLLPFNTWWGLLGWGLIYAAVIVAFVLFYKNLDKINAWLKKRKK